jgi:hypothetical protein
LEVSVIEGIVREFNVLKRRKLWEVEDTAVAATVAKARM